MKKLEYITFNLAIFASSGLVLFCMKHGEDIKTAFGV